MKLKFSHTCLCTFLCLTQLFIASPITYTNESKEMETFSNHLCVNSNPYHLIINKTHSLPKDYVPSQLVVPNVPFSFEGFHEKSQLEPTTAHALEALFKQATSEGIILYAVSGYRSYDRQAQLYNGYVLRDGEAKANTYSAKPGHSEHQTGLAIDVSTPSIGNALTTALGYTKEGIWLSQNAHTYGFIVRYPEGKEHITGYMYEPWHLRYVGTALATTLYTSGLTMEEMIHCCTLPPSASKPASAPEITSSTEQIVQNTSNDLIEQMLEIINTSAITRPLNEPSFIINKTLRGIATLLTQL